MNEEMTPDTPNHSDEEQTNLSPLEALQSEVETLRAENADLKDRYLRTMAEMENLRRRTDRDKQETVKYALEKLMTEVLPVLDVFETALQSARSSESADAQAIAAGTELVFKQLTNTLAKHGLVRLNSADQPFDPNLHQAIQRIEDESCKAETVSQVFAEGYTLNGRLLRPAMVAVRVPNA